MSHKMEKKIVYQLRRWKYHMKTHYICNQKKITCMEKLKHNGASSNNVKLMIIHMEIIPPQPYVNVANGDPSIIYIVSVFARLV